MADLDAPTFISSWHDIRPLTCLLRKQVCCLLPPQLDCTRAGHFDYVFCYIQVQDTSTDEIHWDSDCMSVCTSNTYFPPVHVHELRRTLSPWAEAPAKVTDRVTQRDGSGYF